MFAMLQHHSMGFVALHDFFWKLIRRSFGDLGLSDAKMIDYISEMMARFARTENLYKIKRIESRKLETVVDMLWEIISASGTMVDRSQVYRERIIRQHIGDYTLFMTGIFREYVVRVGILGYYQIEGERSYRAVFELVRMLNEPHGGLFRTLADQFEFVSSALDYTKKVYFRPGMHTGPYQEIIRHLSMW